MVAALDVTLLRESRFLRDTFIQKVLGWERRRV